MTKPELGSFRPRDLALLFLATRDEAPRQRARDQQADRLGLDLRRRVLDRLAALDPEPEEMEMALSSIVSEFGEPSGPTRGVCLAILQDWNSAKIGPEFWPWLLQEAIESSRDREPRRVDRGSDDVA